MDGYGKNDSDYGNAIAMAKKPNLDRLMAQYPMTYIGASGLDVGLPNGQMGNSEVGHTNIGAGRVVYQPLTRITKAFEDGEAEKILHLKVLWIMQRAKHFTLSALFHRAVYIHI